MDKKCKSRINWAKNGQKITKNGQNWAKDGQKCAKQIMKCSKNWQNKQKKDQKERKNPMLISKPPQGYGHHILYQYFNYINVLGSGGSVVLLTLPNSP